MKKTEFYIEGTVQLVLEHTEGEKSSRMKHTNFVVDVSKNMDRSKYVDKDGLPTKDGSTVLTQCLLSGLIANIHLAHEKGWKDSAENLREVIKKMEDLFIQVPNIRTSTLHK